MFWNVSIVEFFCTLFYFVFTVLNFFSEEVDSFCVGIKLLICMTDIVTSPLQGHHKHRMREWCDRLGIEQSLSKNFFLLPFSFFLLIYFLISFLQSSLVVSLKSIIFEWYYLSVLNCDRGLISVEMKSSDSFYGMIGGRKGQREEQKERGRLKREELFFINPSYISIFCFGFIFFYYLIKNRLGKI